MSFRSFSLLLVFLSITLIAAKTSPPGPTVDCSDPKDQLFRAACKAGDQSQCCGMGTGCCAGGCCNPGDRCVGQGTSEEGCCSISDLDFCGVDPSNVKPDVPCGVPGFEKTFYCPHGTLCNIEEESCDSSSNVGKSPLAKSSVRATADASSTQTSPRNTLIPFSNNVDAPEASATSAAKNPNAASTFSADYVFSVTMMIVASFAIVVMLRE